MLDLAPRHAERIDVGRPAREHTDQDAISLLLTEKAREGKVVARLKQGDPFIFDRGGEEALFLHEHGIPFEVVPGVPTSLGAAAYAGIPLTYPGGGDTLTFVRGHEAGNGERPQGGLGAAGRSSTARSCCSAATPTWPRVVDELLAHGRPEDDTAALISRGHAGRARTPASARSASWRRRSPRRRSTAPRRSSSARSSACAITCAGSTSGRSSGAACW